MKTVVEDLLYLRKHVYSAPEQLREYEAVD